MRWTDALRPTLMLGLVLPLAAGSAAADVMILRATGPSSPRFTAGRMLPDNAKIALVANDQLVLLDAHGTRTLTGPGGFVAGAVTSGGTTSLASLAGARTERRARIGAVRGEPGSGPAFQPNIWFVDAGKSGTACVTSATGVTLWRADSETEGDMTVAGPSAKPATLHWIKGQTTKAWPQSVPVAAGGAYRLTGAGVPAGGSNISFAIVPPVADGDMQALANTMAAHGCKAQVDVFIAATSQQ
ncbi:hypothetical protein HZF05_04070 [Sphingomonas sp. CGMCC 1.13654]|uniref:Uncharacterized protein n=1 Tax=Sphingomonas chungangi TaxID=2683589 RepID=A0A838L249_9SPHN|nr:hypothetical protein [Sphingomonas chungangi]MBA2933264.1 hypothetical protein [Sphingomonas chungangi]MVW57934.1 hypothetical protein [Sphingomonas chungangi]